MTTRPSRREEFEIAVVCALPLEYDAVALAFDEFWGDHSDMYGRAKGDPNTYSNGRIGRYNVVLALLPNMDKENPASATARLRSSYTGLRLVFLTGICSGVPSPRSDQEIVLGDVVISTTIVQYDYSPQHPDNFTLRNTVYDNLGRFNKDIRPLLATFRTNVGRERLQRGALQFLRQIQENAAGERKQQARYHRPNASEDNLFNPEYQHKHLDPSDCGCVEHACEAAQAASCNELRCDTAQLVSRERLDTIQDSGQHDKKGDDQLKIHFGCIGSGNVVLKSGEDRDRIARKHGIIAFEMEGADMWDDLPCIVVKGVCDYADGHKNKRWQAYAAATPASVLKALLARYVQPDKPASDHSSAGTSPTQSSSSRPIFHGLTTGKYAIGGQHVSGGATNITFHAQGRNDEAEKLSTEVLGLYHEVLDNRQLDTIRSLANLAVTYHDQGRYEEAQKIVTEALYVSSLNGHVEVVKFLLERGADVTVATNDGRTPLYTASQNGHPEIIKLLLDKGADITVVTKHGQTPLHAASENSHPEVVRLLIELGSDINTATNNGLTPLHLASENGHPEVVRLLIELGADTTVVTKHGQTPLHAASENSHPEVVRLLIELGSDINTATNNGLTPLHLASENGHPEVVRLLIELGADTTVVTKHGQTPLHLASENSHPEVVRLLVELGSDIIAATNDGRTPLYIASQNGHFEVVKLLIDKGADIATATKKGRIPLDAASLGAYYGNALQAASRAGHENIVQMLLGKGADVSAQGDKHGKTLQAEFRGGHQAPETKDLGVCEQFAEILYGDAQIQAFCNKVLRSHDSDIFHHRFNKIIMRYLRDLRRSTKSDLCLRIICILTRMERQRQITKSIIGLANANDGGNDEARRLEYEVQRSRLQEGKQADHDSTENHGPEFGKVEVEVLRLTESEESDQEVESGESSDDSDVEVVGSLQRDEIKSVPNLNLVKDYFSSGQPFDSLKYRLEYLSNPPTNIPDALKTGSTGMLAIFLERRFRRLATGDYDWLSDLKDMGYSYTDIADLLYQKFHDGHWIYFDSNLPPSSFRLPAPSANHLERCAHMSLKNKTTRSRAKLHLEPYGAAEIERKIEELCGLGGIAPDSRDPSLWNGTVEFVKDQGSLIAIITHSTSQESIEDTKNTVSRLLRVVERIIGAAITLQDAGLCCESFTILIGVDPHDQNGQHQVSLRRLSFEFIVEVNTQLQRLNDYLASSLKVDGAEAFQDILAEIQRLSDIVVHSSSLNPRVPLSTISGDSLEKTMNMVSLAIQVLGVGLLSYSQAHIGEIHPFFLDMPLRQLILVGLESSSLTPAKTTTGFKVCLTKLTCLHEMVGDEVMVFYPLSYESAPGTTFDVAGTLEDLLDTWGPGRLVHRKSQQDVPVAVAVRGGFIGRSLLGNNPSSHHWDRNLKLLDLTVQLDLQHEVNIGSLVQENPNCNNDFLRCRRACRHFELGTHRSHLQASGVEYGVEIGPEYLKGSIVKTISRRPAVTIKDKRISPGAVPEMLTQHLDKHWGVRVSYCTGLAQRVSLRHLVGDLFPYFAKALLGGEDKRSLADLEANGNRVAERFRAADVTLDTLRDWLTDLPANKYDLVMRITIRILETLKDTGISPCGRFFSLAWPKDGEVDSCVRIGLQNVSARWIPILADSDSCATFAYVANVCLEKDDVVCDEQALDGVYKLPLLETAILCQSPGLNICTHSALRHKDNYYFERASNFRWWVRAEKTGADENTPVSLIRLDKIERAPAMVRRLMEYARAVPSTGQKIEEHFVNGQNEVVWILSEKLQ